MTGWTSCTASPTRPSPTGRDRPAGAPGWAYGGVAHVHRLADQAVTARAALDALLDSQWVGVLSCVADGAPLAVPMLYARDGDRLLLHGSTGAGALRRVAV